MTPLWLVLIFLGFLYILYFGLLTKPERSVYAFLVVWISFPKGVERLPVIGNLGIDGLAIFTVVSLSRRRASGWAWLMWAGIFAVVGTMLYRSLRSRGSGGFGGGAFGGGFSGGGGASGSW